MSRWYKSIVSNVITYVQAIVQSAGVADGGKIVATDPATGRLHLSVLPSSVGTPTEVTPATEALGAGDFVEIYSASGTRSCRRADASLGRKAHGYVTTAVTSGQNATVFKDGTNTALTGVALGTDYYLSNSVPGGFSATPPAFTNTGHIIQHLGFGVSTTGIEYEYSESALISG